jgi:hypothetical protein
MKKEQTAIHLNGNYWGAEVVQGGFNFQLFGGVQADQIRYSSMPSPGKFRNHEISIPPGEWQIAGKDLNLDQIYEVIKGTKFTMNQLLHKRGLKVETTLIIRKIN